MQKTVKWATASADDAEADGVALHHGAAEERDRHAGERDQDGERRAAGSRTTYGLNDHQWKGSWMLV